MVKITCALVFVFCMVLAAMIIVAVFVKISAFLHQVSTVLLPHSLSAPQGTLCSVSVFGIEEMES